MFVRVVDAKYIDGYKVSLRFKDGAEGVVDLENDLNGPIFEPLKNLDYFRTLSVNHDIHTIVWGNGADISPEFLYNKMNSNKDFE